MLIGYFTERPYQDPNSGYFGNTGRAIQDLNISNAEYDPYLGAELYNRYIDEKIALEENGFDVVCLNEHHSTPFCMGGVVNVEAAILARVTKKVKIALIGNVLPIHDDPLWLAEQLATIDMFSHGRLITGWVRGGGRESYSHNAPPTYNWERYNEAHDFIVKAWTEPGPWRWEGKHFQYRYVNPWARPYQSPHPQMWIPGTVSRRTMEWAAERSYPYIMLATDIEATRDSFQQYHEYSAELGMKSGPENLGYMFKVHLDDTEEKAYEVGRKFIEGPSNPFIVGNEGQVNPFIQGLPGLSPRRNKLPTGAFQPLGRAAVNNPQRLGNYDEQLEKRTIIAGTPDTVLPKIRHVLETLRPGSAIFWDGDGAMSHEDSMRSIRLFGEYVLPEVREMGKELGLTGPFDEGAATNPPTMATPRSNGSNGK
jgi:alkanesulfonate monooxygenase SsuD/methylene tetrahydromethanopterin reductase-like flavin-dependent oxidoreductase (luciferase family)